MLMRNDYRIETFKVEHFAQLDHRDPDTQAMAAHPGHNTILKHYVNVSYAFTGFYKDDIIAIGGLLPLWDGVAEAWIFTGQDFAKHKRFVYTQVKKHLDDSFKFFGLKRIQAVCLKDFIQAHNFAKHLGFQVEGTLRRYMYDRDYLMYARLANDSQAE